MAEMTLLGAIGNLLHGKDVLQPVGTRGWWPLIREPFAGAWQQNQEWRADSVLAYPPVYACVRLISSDIGKCLFRLMQLDSADGIWSPIESAAFSPVLRKPNRYQNAIQFKQWWITSKLTRGNTYALKQRDARGVVTALYILDPCMTLPLVAPDGSVYYQLSEDNLAGVKEGAITVPASEIIHDRMNCLFHPLVGISPLFACGAAADQGLKIQTDSSKFFSNAAVPNGVLSAPGAISDETATRLKAHWETNYGGTNFGKVAVLGDDLKFVPMRMNSVDSQLIEQLKWTAEMVCMAFGVPLFKLGLGTTPTYQNAEVLNQIYYSDCLQILIEDMELCLDEGLSLPRDMGVELDLDGLLRMDSATLVKTLTEEVKGSISTPNEARKRMNRKPLKGGDTVYMQMQNYSLEALSKRDAREDPFAKSSPTPAPATVDDGDGGKSAQTISALILPQLQEHFAKLTESLNLQDRDQDEFELSEKVQLLVASKVQAAMAAIPAPAPGKDADPVDPAAISAQLLPQLQAEFAKWAEANKPKDGEPGTSITVDQIAPIIQRTVLDALAVVPSPNGDKGEDQTDHAIALLYQRAPEELAHA